MDVLYRTPDLFGVFLEVAREYKIPIRMARNDQPFQSLLSLMTPADPIPDAIFSPGPRFPHPAGPTITSTSSRTCNPG
jgi:hypothetical protein